MGRKLLLGVAILSTILWSNAWGEQGERRRFTYLDFSGGLNNRKSPVAIEDNEASDLQNVTPTEAGKLKKRLGGVKYNSTSIPGNEEITGLNYYRQTDGDDWLVATTSNSNIFTSTNVNGEFTRITGTASWTGSRDVLADFTTAQDVLIIEDGATATAPWKWEPEGSIGRVVALGGSPPNSTMVEWHKNHLFLATTASSDVTFSNLGALQLWDAGDAVTVEGGGGSGITALWKQLDSLYVGKIGGIFRISGDNRNDFSVEQTVEGIGPVNNAATLVIDNVAFFLTQDARIYAYDGEVGLQRIGFNIEGTLEELSHDRFDEASATERDRDYWIFLTSSGGARNNRALEFDTRLKSWWLHTGSNVMSVNAATEGYDANGLKQFYTGSYNGIVYRHQGNNDDGQRIQAFWKSKAFYYPDISHEKVLRTVNVFAEPDGNWSITVEALTDFEGTGQQRTVSLSLGTSLWNTAVWGTDAWGGTAGLVATKPPLGFDEAFDFLQMQFENNNPDEPFTVLGYTVDVDETGRP